MEGIQPPDPMKELLDNFDSLRPVKRCPQCSALALEFDARTGRIFCAKCGFERFMPRMGQ